MPPRLEVIAFLMEVKLDPRFDEFANALWHEAQLWLDEVFDVSA